MLKFWSVFIFEYVCDMLLDFFIELLGFVNVRFFGFLFFVDVIENGDEEFFIFEFFGVFGDFILFLFFIEVDVVGYIFFVFLVFGLDLLVIEFLF